MASLATITLRKKPNKRGLFPLSIRVTKNRKSSYIYLGHYLDLKYWDENRKCVRKSHPNANYLNNLIATKLAETSKILLELQTNNSDITPLQIKDEIIFKDKGKSFFEVADVHLKESIANKKFSRISVEKAYINHLKRYSKSKALIFQDIDEKFLKDYKTHLIINKSLSERTVVNHFVFIRLIFNRAIRNGIVDRKFYPFGIGKIIIKFPESRKIGLTIEEILAIENLDNLSPEEEHARNVWLFSFYLAGIRIGDLLKIRWSDIYDGRLHYTMSKNSKIVSLKLPEKIHPILESYLKFKDGADDFVFPELKVSDRKNPEDIYIKIKTANKRLNRQLTNIASYAKISKKLTMHIARHSFGQIAGDTVPVQLLQKLYRHSSVTTTMMYQSSFISTETDRALENIVNF